MNWDDSRLFLALIRGGSVRAAASRAGVGHATIARRMRDFEQRLGTSLLERTSAGFTLTAAGEQVRDAAEQMEAAVLQVERRIAGKDAALEGVLRVAIIDVLATELLMDDLADFTRAYPDIELELLIGYRTVSLERREADVAVRLTDRPGEQLIGREVGVMRHAGYATDAYLKEHDPRNGQDAQWVGFGTGERYPAWVRNSGFPHVPARHNLDSILLQIAAVKAGMGLGFLPCFVGDPDPDLIRVDTPDHFPQYGVWILRHADTRGTARLRVFSDFMAQAIRNKSALLSGQ